MRERFELWFLNKYPGMSLDTETARHDYEVWEKSWVSCGITHLTAVIQLIPGIEVAA